MPNRETNIPFREWQRWGFSEYRHNDGRIRYQTYKGLCRMEYPTFILFKIKLILRIHENKLLNTKTLRQMAATRKTGSTGVVAKIIQLYGILDPESLLKHGKKVAFVKGPAE
jgi:hypothetical protein